MFAKNSKTNLKWELCDFLFRNFLRLFLFSTRIIFCGKKSSFEHRYMEVVYGFYDLIKFTLFSLSLLGIPCVFIKKVFLTIVMAVAKLLKWSFVIFRTLIPRWPDTNIFIKSTQGSISAWLHSKSYGFLYFY